MPVSRVAEIDRLHHSNVKELDKIYMRRQIELKGDPKPRAIGIDEISIRKGHNYRIVVSDLMNTDLFGLVVTGVRSKIWTSFSNFSVNHG